MWGIVENCFRDAKSTQCWTTGLSSTSCNGQPLRELFDCHSEYGMLNCWQRSWQGHQSSWVRFAGLLFNIFNSDTALEMTKIRDGGKPGNLPFDTDMYQIDTCRTETIQNGHIIRLKFRHLGPWAYHTYSMFFLFLFTLIILCRANWGYPYYRSSNSVQLFFFTCSPNWTGFFLEFPSHQKNRDSNSDQKVVFSHTHLQARGTTTQRQQQRQYDI